MVLVIYLDLLHESIKYKTSCKERSEVKCETRYFCTSESESLPRARVNSKFSRYKTKKVKWCQDIQTLRGRRLRRKVNVHEHSARESKTLAVLKAVGKWGLNLLCTLLSASYRSGRENFKRQTQSEHSVFFSRTVRLKLLWKIIKIHLNKQAVNSICPYSKIASSINAFLFPIIATFKPRRKRWIWNP